jgi:chaperonin cofactor prefoldin
MSGEGVNESAAVRRVVLLGVFAALATLPIAAQVARSGGSNNVSGQLLQQYQQATAERATLQGENARLKQELESVKSKLTASDRQLAAARGAAGSRAALAAAQLAAHTSEQALEQTRVRLQELITRFRDTTAALSGVETERAQAHQQLAAMNTQYDICAERNYELYEMNGEALTHLEHPGVWSGLVGHEPFTRLQRTRLENLVDDYRARALELRVRARPVDASGQAAVPKN